RKRSNRRSIYLDGDFFCGVDAEVIERLGLKEGMEVDEEQMLRITLTEEKLKAKRYALNLLSYRMRSRSELTGRLRQKGFDGDMIGELADDLEQVGLLDDLEFAKSWIRTRMDLNPKSFYAIEKELYRKGVKREVIEQAEDELRGQFDEKMIALSVARKRLASLKGLEPRDVNRRILGFLSRRGFSYEIAKWVIEELKGQKRYDVQ
ncbi:MAG: regulatory protein RecX, partial [bacterium]